MDVTTQQMEKLMHGQYTFSQWAFSMLLTQLKNKYSTAPTEENLERCTNELNGFLTKYKTILSKEIAVISNI